MMNVAETNINAMFEARQNPNILGALMGQMKSDNMSLIKEIDLLVEPTPGQMITDGYMFPHIVRGIIEPVKNRIIKENSYRGRRRGLGNYPVIKADLTGKLVRNEDGIVVSEDDITTMTFLKQKLNVSSFDDVNEALRTNPVYLLAGRWPVYASVGVYLAKVERVIEKGHGNVVWYHPESSFGKLQADHDGDNSFIHMMYFGPNFTDNTVVNEMLKPEVKEEFEKQSGFVRLEYFEGVSDEYKYTKKDDMYVVGGRLGVGLHSQGIITNAITFFEDMNHKGFKATIGKQTIVTRDIYNDKAFMRYAPLKDNITNDMLEAAGMGVLVDKGGNPWEEDAGKKYLMTNPITELRIMLQAAVDNAKELMLSKWKYRDYDTLMPIMFKQDNGSPIGKKQNRTIARNLRKLLSYGDMRRGRDVKTRRVKGISGMFEDSRGMYELLQMRPKERSEHIRKRANDHRDAFQSRQKNTLEIESLSFNKNVTPIENLLATPYRVMREYMEANPNDLVWEHPWGYDDNRIVNAIVQTQKDMYSIQSKTERWYPMEGWDDKKEEARAFINEAADEFHNIHAMAELYNSVSKSNLTAAGYPYNEEILDWMNKWYHRGNKKMGIKAFKDLDEHQQAYTTLRFLRGTTRQTKFITKKLKGQSARIVKNMMKMRDKINDPSISEKSRATATKSLTNLNNRLKELMVIRNVMSMSRIRDIETILPAQLMHKGVWQEYIERFGPNLREASSDPVSLKMNVRYEEQNDKSDEQIIGKCK